MNKIKIKIPAGIRYLGEILNFELPNGIFDKGVTGCGATTKCLVDEYPMILVAPRRALLENKAEQHKDTVLWVRPESFNKDLGNYLEKIKTPKLLVTYDSFPTLKKHLGKDICKYRIVVDEFHRLLKDSTFKSNTEYRLLKHLEGLPYVTYLSATPIKESFIRQSEFLSKIPYYEADWEQLEQVTIKTIKSEKSIDVLKRIISVYQNNGEYKVPLEDGTKYISKEGIFFINSINTICSIIKLKELKPEEVNILISNTDNNAAFLKKKLGSKYKIGKAPMKGEKNKMFTFCTSTAFDGVDFYSDNAILFAFSSLTNKNTLLDVSTDLQQIAGRQRMIDNPLFNRIFFIYNSADDDIFNIENNINIEEVLNKKKEKALALIETLNKSSEEVRKEILSWKEKACDQSFIYINENGMAEYNELMYFAEQDALETIHSYLKNGISTIIRHSSKLKLGESIYLKIYRDIEYYHLISRSNQILRRIPTEKEYLDNLHILKTRLSKNKLDLIDTYGFNLCKMCLFLESRIIAAGGLNLYRDKFRNLIRSEFENHEMFLSNADLKNYLTYLYKSNSINKAPKATDVFRYFTEEEVCETRKQSKGKRVYGYRLS